MAIHWTEFPERVEKFGDLFNIFETLDRDFLANGLEFSDRTKMSDASAYKVKLLFHGSEFIPRPERIPGWDELASFTERQLCFPPSLVTLRMVRSMALEALNVPIAAVNEMSILEVVEALTGTNRRPASADTNDTFAEFRWLRVRQIARLFAMNAGAVSKLADAGTIRTNGQSGIDRRIDVLSVIRCELERLERRETTDSPSDD